MADASRKRVRTLPKRFVYPFFAVHMAMFGLSGFLMAYGRQTPRGLAFLYMHGGIAIVVYPAFCVQIFGRDQVHWMFINAALGILGIHAGSAGSSNASTAASGTTPGRCTWCRCCTTCSTPSCCASS